MSIGLRPHSITKGRDVRARWATVSAIVMATLTLAATQAMAATTDLDRAFGGGDGWVHSGFMCCEPPRPALDSAADLAVQRDGRIIALGYSWQREGRKSYPQLGLFRYLPDGSPDPSFGPSGTGGVMTTFPRSLQPGEMALQPNGKIVVAVHGWTVDTPTLIRYNRDGSLDASFGQNGRVVSPIPGFSGALAVAIQRSGRIVVGGSTSSSDFILAAYRRDGTLDDRFGSEGTASVDFPHSIDYGELNELAIDDRGRILAAGSLSKQIPLIPPSDDVEFDRRMGVARFLADGTLDTDFGIDGRTLVSFTRGRVDERAFVDALAVQNDGSILLGGAMEWDGSDGPALARFDRNGRIDRSFGDGGRLTPAMLPPLRGIRDLVVDSHDRILAASVVSRGTDSYAAAVIRLLPNGSLDADFSGDGVATTGMRHDHYGRTIALQDGRILVAGGITNYDKWFVDFAVFAFRR